MTVATRRCWTRPVRLHDRPTGAGAVLPLAEGDLLRALPQRAAAELLQLLLPLDERREVVRPQVPRLRRERAVPVREQQLGLALAAGVQRELARVRVRRRVLRPDPEVAVAPRDPVRLPAPAAVDDPILERQDRAERRHRLRCELLLPPCDESHPRSDDLEHGRNLPPRARNLRAERLPTSSR